MMFGPLFSDKKITLSFGVLYSGGVPCSSRCLCGGCGYEL